jgi:hypothetical protein
MVTLTLTHSHTHTPRLTRSPHTRRPASPSFTSGIRAPTHRPLRYQASHPFPSGIRPLTPSPPVSGFSLLPPPVSGLSLLLPPVSGFSLLLPPVSGFSLLLPPVCGLPRPRGSGKATCARPSASQQTTPPPPSVSLLPSVPLSRYIYVYIYIYTCVYIYLSTYIYGQPHPDDRVRMNLGRSSSPSENEVGDGAGDGDSCRRVSTAGTLGARTRIGRRRRRGDASLPAKGSEQELHRLSDTACGRHVLHFYSPALRCRC